MSRKRFEKSVPRRDFLGKAAWGSFALTMGTALIGIVRLPKPGVLPESASRFKVGFPDDFAPDTRRTIPRRNVWVFRDDLGFYAISAICSHLGCVVSETAKGDGFTCPCHGSKFDATGKNGSGPAPRPLPWHPLTLSGSGALVVDLGAEVSADAALQTKGGGS